MANINFWIEIVVAILTGLATCIPLVIKLIEVIKDSVRNKNWAPMMQLVLKLMAEAEENYATGEEKRVYVLDSIKALESTLNYDIDVDIVNDMITAIINATKKININKTEE